MNELPERERRRGRILRIPSRKGIWLFEYSDIKYETRLQWRLHLISGSIALIVGSVMLVVLIVQAKRGDFELVPILFATCGVLWGILYAPAAVIYFIRRRRGEPTDFFDYEVVDRGHHVRPKD